MHRNRPLGTLPPTEEKDFGPKGMPSPTPSHYLSFRFDSSFFHLLPTEQGDLNCRLDDVRAPDPGTGPTWAHGRPSAHTEGALHCRPPRAFLDQTRPRGEHRPRDPGRALVQSLLRLRDPSRPTSGGGSKVPTDTETAVCQKPSKGPCP